MAGILAVFALAALTNAAPTTSSPKGAVVLPLVREVNYYAYLTKFGVGTPPQYEYTVMDTGSPFIAFENPKNDVCSEKSRPCKRYGTFVNTSSSTSKYVSSGFNDALIDFGAGDTLSDVLRVNGVTSQKFEFGYIDAYAFTDQVAKPTHTICGLGLDCNKLDSSCYNTSTSLTEQFHQQGLITRRAVSIYLGPEQPGVKNAEIILGNAYDKAKQASTPFSIPMVAGQGTTNFVNASALSVTIKGKTTRLALNKYNNITLLDTGNPFLAITEPMWTPIQQALGLPANHSAQNDVPYKGNVSCSGRNLPTSDVFTVEFGGTNKISVPLAQMVTDFGDGQCGSFLYYGGPAKSGISVLGDPFLRGAYFTLDADNFKVTLSQVKYTSASQLVPLISS